MQLVGDYRWGGCTLDGHRYSVRLNGGRIERIMRRAENGEPENVEIWASGDPMTELFFRIMGVADFTPAPLPGPDAVTAPIP